MAKMLSKEDITRFNNLLDENGNFKSAYPGNPKTGLMSIGYLDEFNEFMYLNPQVPFETKAINIKLVELEIINAIKIHKATNLQFYVPSMWHRLLTSQN